MTRQERRHRLRWLLTLISMIVAIGVLFIWAMSWRIETEVRWMHEGTHRHLELARGTVTYVTTTGCQSADYWTWATSPNLSFGRDPNWYEQSDPGESRWHVRINWAVILLSVFIYLAIALRRLQVNKLYSIWCLL